MSFRDMNDLSEFWYCVKHQRVESGEAAARPSTASALPHRGGGRRARWPRSGAQRGVGQRPQLERRRLEDERAQDIARHTSAPVVVRRDGRLAAAFLLSAPPDVRRLSVVVLSVVWLVLFAAGLPMVHVGAPGGVVVVALASMLGAWLVVVPGRQRRWLRVEHLDHVRRTGPPAGSGRPTGAGDDVVAGREALARSRSTSASMSSMSRWMPFSSPGPRLPSGMRLTSELSSARSAGAAGCHGPRPRTPAPHSSGARTRGAGCRVDR